MEDEEDLTGDHIIYIELWGGNVTIEESERVVCYKNIINPRKL